MPTLRRLRYESLEDRLTPGAGDLDPTFGVGGKTTVPFGSSAANATDVAVLPGGKILMAGDAGGDFAVTRLNPDGTLDASFGTGGRATIPFDLGQFDFDQATALAVQPDGKIVLAGSVNTGDVEGAFGVVRLTADGALDPTFGTGGKLTIPFDLGGPDPFAMANDLAVQPDGKIVVVGAESHIVLGPTGGTQFMSFAVARLNPDGTLDPTFDGDGKLTLAFGDRDRYGTEARAVILQPDGKIVVTGGAGAAGNDTDFAAVRLNPDGSLDPTFGAGGRVVVPVSPPGPSNDTAYDAALQSDGSILLAGSAGLSGSADFAAVRLTADGQLDPTFGAGGAVTVPFDLGQLNGDVAKAVLALPDGKIILAGAAYRGNGNVDFAAARLNPDGTLDPEFDGDGKLTVPFDLAGTLADFALAAAVQPDGKIVLAGTAYTTDAPATMAAARLEGEPLAPFPGTVLVGGSPDRAAIPLNPLGGRYEPGQAVSFFPGFAGTVRTAVADVTGDGIPDLIGGAGPGGGPRVAVLDGKTGVELASFFAFEPTFTGGVFVAAADLTGDGKAEVVVTPDRGGGPVVAVFDGTGTERGRFFGIDDPNFRGGARATLGDVNGDDIPDLMVSAGFSGGPRIALYDGQTIAGGGPTPVKLVSDFFAFENSLRNGAFVTAGDVTDDGVADVAFGGGPGGAPRVRLIDGKALLAAGPFSNLDAVPTAQRVDFFAGDSSLRGGVRIVLRDADGDGKADLVTGSGEGEPSRVQVYKSANLLANPNPTADQELDPFGAVLADGVFVG